MKTTEIRGVTFKSENDVLAIKEIKMEKGSSNERENVTKGDSYSPIKERKRAEGDNAAAMKRKTMH